MISTKVSRRVLPAALLALFALPASAQTFKVQCPDTTSLHPAGTGIKCQQISGGDGFATMGDGTQTYLFAFGPLSGLADHVAGLPGTETNTVFNEVFNGDPNNFDVGDPTPTRFPLSGGFNGAVGLAPDPDAAGALTGHVDPRPIMDVGVMNGNIPAPLMAIDEDDEFFLTLTNVGQVMRPDLFEQHTVHFHGYPNASAFYDGVPDASVAINIGGSFTYYYTAPDPGTYIWHCHITPPEHLEMGMVGQMYVRAAQNNASGDLSTWLTNQQNSSVRKKCAGDILCTNPPPAIDTGAASASGVKYAYNDGDGVSAYEIEYPLQMHGFDPNFHFVGMTFNPETFTDLKDKYFLLNGRSYPDTINPASLATQSSDGVERNAQVMRSVINIPAGQRALLRLSDLNVSEFHTLASLGIRMHVVGLNAKLLRDDAGNNLDYYTNSITLGGGESVDVILDACHQRDADGTCPADQEYGVGEKYYLYTPQLDHLSNDAENFGGMMTEVNICTSVDQRTKTCS